ncbi:MAG: FAD-dependent oxidoreductase [Candidatus Methylacidiphilales bacterium]
MPHIDQNRLDWVPIDPEQLKRIYDDVVITCGATILFNTHLSAVKRDGDGIDAIIVTNKAGLTAYRATTYVDCTGDADLCAWGGASFQKGNAQGACLMPATHCFVLSNVDEEALKAGPGIPAAWPDSPIYKIRDSGKYPLIPDCHICIAKLGPGTYGFNAGHVWDVDNTRPETVSTALVLGRKMAISYRNSLAEFFPSAFGNCFLVNTGSLLGIRETRRVIGDYVLTLVDYLQRRSFEDEICRNCYFIDVHPTKLEIANNPEEYRDSCEKGVHYGPGESHGIPYRSLIPRGLENVLVAGRSISCEQIVQGSVRVMPVCLAMGEAAGLAAAIASTSHKGRVRDVDASSLRQQLRQYGAYLPEVEEMAEAVAG